MKIRETFRRGKIVDALKSVGVLRFRISHSSLMLISLLSLILLIAFLIRILPLRWGFHLSEFDPYFQYRLGRYMLDNGFLSWVSWHDYMRWYPYGVDVAHSYPGLSATAASLYGVLRTLGLSPAPMFTSNPLTTDPFFNFCVIFPVIMGTITCLVIYFLGKDIGGKEVGLFSALFLALNSSFISRTSLGFFDDESVGIFGILLFIFFFLRAVEPERPLRNGLSYAIASGLSLGYLLISWGAALYPLGMTLIFVLVLILLRRYSPRLLLSYSVTFGLGLFIAVNIPKLGFGFLTEPYILAVPGVLLLLGFIEVFRHIRTPKMKTIFVFSFFVCIVVLLLALSWYGHINPMPYKWWTIINPGTRFESGAGPQLIQSVQEHRPAAWGTFYFDLGIGALLVPFGLFFAVQNPTNRNLFLIIFSLTSLYFASSMVRLTLLMAPALSILWALALVRLLRPFITIMKEIPAIPSRKLRFQTHVGREFSAGLLILTLLLLTFTLALPGIGSTSPRIISHAYSPTTIAAASMPVKPVEPVSDWVDALNWMRVNLNSTDVVASWWDYGYWITIVANKTSLADNGTVNSTQIGQIGSMFMSNETEAVKILKELGATHVVVFTTFTSDGADVGWGDEGKWRWMARIALLDENDYGNVTEGGTWEWNTKGQETVIYKLMQYGRDITLSGSSTVQLAHFVGPPEGYFSQTAGAPTNYGGAIPLVCVYKIEY